MPNSAALAYRQKLSEHLPPLPVDEIRRAAEAHREQQERFVALFRRP